MSRQSDILRAFGEDTRLRILRLVATHELSVSELVDALQLAQSRISRHLAVLRQAGMVADRREGNWVYYAMADSAEAPLAAALWEAIREHSDDSAFFPDDLDRLDETLARREIRSKEYFDVVASQWDRIKRHYIDETLSPEAISGLVRPEAVAVDVGTGTGDVLVALARTVAKVVGVDSSQKMLDACRQRLDAEGLGNVDLRLGSAEALPLGDGECDAVFCSMLLHHLADPAIGIRELARVVKPGGKVVITDLVKHEFDWAREVMADLWLGFAEEQIRDWAAQAGLMEVTYTSASVPTPLESEPEEKLRAFLATATKPAS